MKNYDFEKEQTEHPYEYYGHVKEEKHGEGTFLLKTALHYVIDDYDEYIGSVEQSHYDVLDYYEITNFDFPYNIETLDLTWMDPNDTFHLDKSEQYEFVQTIRANIDNLGYSYLPYNDKGKKILLIINGSKTKSSIVEQVRNFKRFITHNKEYLTGVQFTNFSQLFEKILTLYAKKLNVPVVESEEKNYTRQKRL